MNTQKENSVRIITTGDGSHSLYHEELHETYHSTHGALRESEHVFIEAGFNRINVDKKQIQLLEIGFGTGLNAWLTAKSSEKNGIMVNYFSLEPFPISSQVYHSLSFGETTAAEQNLLQQLHESPWEIETPIHPYFNLHKSTTRLQTFETDIKFDLIYYDAFGPPAQPEMWTKELLQKISNMMNSGGILVTYCAKGQVRRDLQSSGLTVERLPGPPGKREMLRAIKP